MEPIIKFEARWFLEGFWIAFKMVWWLLPIAILIRIIERWANKKIDKWKNKKKLIEK